MSGRTRDRIYVYIAGVIALSMFAAAMLLTSPVHAQQAPDGLQPVVAFGGAQIQYARPVGEFHDYVQHGFGVNANVVWPVRTESVLALRGDGGFIVYGSETQRVCFSSTVGCRVELDLTTTNSIAYVNIGPQLMVPRGAVRPYANAAIGFSYFGTTSQVEGSSGSEPFASTSNFSDVTFAWTTGGGLLIPVSTGKSPIAIDMGVRYHSNGQVEYLKKGDITDNPDGSISYEPTRSEANLLTFQIGVSVGIRPGTGSQQ